MHDKSEVACLKSAKDSAWTKYKNIVMYLICTMNKSVPTELQKINFRIYLF